MCGLWPGGPGGPPSSCRCLTLWWQRPGFTTSGTPLIWLRLVSTPLDGARYLRRMGVDGQVVSLVAYHSCAHVEADVRGLGAELTSEFPPADPLLTDVLLCCDMTTGPDGDYVRPADRLVEICGRYGPDHEVTPVRGTSRLGDLDHCRSR